MAKVQWVLICLLLLTPTSSAISLLAFLNALIEVGKFALEAVKAYENLADTNRAKALVTIENFSNQPLTQCGVLTGSGLTQSAVPITVFAGYKEGFAVEQNNPGYEVDMILSCRMVADGRIILVHFYINQQVVRRKANELGVAVVSDDCHSVDSFDSALSLIDSESFTGHALQCATDDFVVQTTMSTSHQSDLDILIYPKFCEDFAGVVKTNITDCASLQEDLDAIIDIAQSCRVNATCTTNGIDKTRDGLGSIELWAIGATVLVVAFMTVICLVVYMIRRE